MWYHFSILFTLLPKQSNRQCGARGVDFPAGSFDLALLGVTTLLLVIGLTVANRIRTCVKSHRKSGTMEFSERLSVLNQPTNSVAFGQPITV